MRYQEHNELKEPLSGTFGAVILNGADSLRGLYKATECRDTHVEKMTTIE